jgi:O-acetyl-ADP-ribose deacetylase (regulator of RNase III)
MALHYLIGDATAPIVVPALISHVCNSVGAWGAGFVVALSRKTLIPEAAYRAWAKGTKSDLPLGKVQFVPIADGSYVCNMIAQKGIHAENGVPPIRYDALEQALSDASEFAKKNDLTIAMPRIGAKLAGGDWTKIEEIIKDTVSAECYIYTLPSERNDWPGAVYENIAEYDDDIDLNTIFK